jgi:hypothetical protein
MEWGKKKQSMRKLTVKTVIFVVSFTMHTGRTMQNVTIFAHKRDVGKENTTENKNKGNK